MDDVVKGSMPMKTPLTEINDNYFSQSSQNNNYLLFCVLVMFTLQLLSFSHLLSFIYVIHNATA